MPRSTTTIPRTAVALALLAAAGSLESCRIASAKLWNLDQVHTADGEIQRVGDVRSDLSHVIRAGGLPFQPKGLFESLGDLGKARSDVIKDPLEVCLENQIELGECDLSAPVVRGKAIATYAWLATEDEWFLGRERAVLEIARLAHASGVESAAARPEHASPPEMVRKALIDLHHAFRVPFGDVDVEAAAGEIASDVSVADAAAALRALELDVAGARRSLAAVSLLVERAVTLDRLGSGLAGLQQELMRRTLALALGAALDDRHPIVRAAAFDAGLRLTERPDAALLQRALGREAPLVTLAALRVVQQRGLPAEPPRALPGAGLDSWVALLIELAPSHDGQRSTAACRTLAAVVAPGPYGDADAATKDDAAALRAAAGELAPLHSQRFEDWTGWWERVGKHLARGGARAATAADAARARASVDPARDTRGNSGGAAPAPSVPASKQPRP